MIMMLRSLADFFTQIFAVAKTSHNPDVISNSEFGQKDKN